MFSVFKSKKKHVPSQILDLIDEAPSDVLSSDQPPSGEVESHNSHYSLIQHVDIDLRTSAQDNAEEQNLLGHHHKTDNRSDDNDGRHGRLNTQLESTHDHQNTTGSNNEAHSICWGFLGAIGGIGVTTLCIQAAYDIIGRYKTKPMQPNSASRRPVCIIDLDFENGACASYLDSETHLALSDMGGHPERIDHDLIKALITHHKSGIDIISAGFNLGGNDHVDAECVMALLDQACQIYDHVILDIPRLWRPWTAAILAGCDHVSLVTELHVSALKITRSQLRAIESQVEFESPMNVILNKYERRAFKAALKEKDAQKILGRPIAGKICIDPDAALQAINRGKPLGEVRAEGRYVKDVRSFIDKKTRPSTQAFKNKKVA